MFKDNEELLRKYQEKSVTPVDDYQCNLNPEIQEILKNDFRETEELRQFGIKALRDWTLQNRRIIKTRLDSIWLLKYLRLKKYNIPAAQEAIERHLVIREGVWNENSFHELDVKKSCVQKLLSLGLVCILEARDENKRPIVILRGKGIPSDGECLMKDINTVVALLVEYLNEIEEFQARGVVYVWDCQFFDPKHLKMFTLDRIYKLVKHCESYTAGRHKGFHFVNLHPVFAYPMKFAFECASSKWKERLKVHKNFEEFNLVDRKYLPKEYGGEKPFSELAKNLEQELLKKRDIMLKYQEMKVNRSMYPEAVFDGSVEVLKYPLNSLKSFEKLKSNEIFGIHGSFRKLEID